MLAAFSLASCSDDDDKDITKEINMSVSAEPGIMYGLFDSMGEHPIECMRVMSEDWPGQWQTLYFDEIKGFTYERGHEYELRVKRTILANPPADASDRTYELVRILYDKKVEAIAEPEENIRLRTFTADRRDTPCTEVPFRFPIQEPANRERDDIRPAVDETGRNAALRPHPLQCL